MPNIGGPGNKKRKIMRMRGSSVILYAAEVWEKAIAIKSYREKVEKTTISMADRTISTEALYVNAGLMPVECWTEERMSICRHEMDKKGKRKYQLDKLAEEINS